MTFSFRKSEGGRFCSVQFSRSVVSDSLSALKIHNLGDAAIGLCFYTCLSIREDFWSINVPIIRHRLMIFFIDVALFEK